MFKVNCFRMESLRRKLMLVSSRNSINQNVFADKKNSLICARPQSITSRRLSPITQSVVRVSTWFINVTFEINLQSFSITSNDADVWMTTRPLIFYIRCRMRALTNGHSAKWAAERLYRYTLRCTLRWCRFIYAYSLRR